MLGKPDRYRYTDPADLMDVDWAKRNRLTDYNIPPDQRGDLERPETQDPHIYRPINQAQLHNNTTPKLNPLQVMRAFNEPRMIQYRKYYDPQQQFITNLYQQRYQAYEAYGKPNTTILRAMAIYFIGCGIAMKQGYYGMRFWRFHYFDWMRFIKLGAIFGYGGAGLMGMVLWGDPDIALSRIRSWFRTKQYDDPYSRYKDCNPMPRV